MIEVPLLFFVAVIAAVFSCPAAVLVIVLRRWREDVDMLRAEVHALQEWHREERRELMDRLFARDWQQYKAFELSRERALHPPQDEERDETAQLLHRVGTIAD